MGCVMRFQSLNVIGNDAICQNVLFCKCTIVTKLLEATYNIGEEDVKKQGLEKNRPAEKEGRSLRYEMDKGKKECYKE
jgi:hypothetical protein